MKLFTLFRDYMGIFHKELEPRLEKKMSKSLFIDEDDINIILKESIDSFFTLNMMVKQFNYALKGTDIRYKCIDDIIYLVTYNESGNFKVASHFIHENEDVKSKVVIPTEHFRELFYCYSHEYFYGRMRSMEKHILFNKCCELDKMKEANVMEDTYIIRGGYYDLVETYNYLQSL